MSTETERKWTYAASQQAAEFASKMRYYADDNGERYGRYIEESLKEKVANGRYTHEYALGLRLGDLYHGNDGD
jgi:hypothetical protein